MNGDHVCTADDCCTPKEKRSRWEKSGAMQEVFENATAQVAMWPKWKRDMVDKDNGVDLDEEDRDKYLNIPYVVAAIDEEIVRLKARKKELLAKQKRSKK